MRYSEGSHLPSKLTASKLFYQPSVTTQGKESNFIDETTNMQGKL